MLGVYDVPSDGQVRYANYVAKPKFVAPVKVEFDQKLAAQAGAAKYAANRKKYLEKKARDAARNDTR